MNIINKFLTIFFLRNSQIYLYPVFNLLRTTQYNILAPERSLNGLNVLTTADRKGRYTLLLGSPYSIDLKQASWFKEGLFCFAIIYIRFAIIYNKQIWILSSTHFLKVQPAYTHSIKIHVCVDVACNAFYLTFPCYYRIYVSLHCRFLIPTSEDNPPCAHF